MCVCHLTQPSKQLYEVLSPFGKNIIFHIYMKSKITAETLVSAGSLTHYAVWMMAYRIVILSYVGHYLHWIRSSAPWEQNWNHIHDCSLNVNLNGSEKLKIGWKWARNLNRDSSKENSQMSNKVMGKSFNITVHLVN